MRKLRSSIFTVIVIIAMFQNCVLAVPTQYSISITRRAQQQSNWCWAATAQMIGSKYCTVKSQENIVKTIKGAVINKGGTDSDVASAIQYACDAKYSVKTKGVQTYSTVQSNIAGNKLIGVKMEWNSGGVHAVVLTGYTTTGGVTLVDPAVNCGKANYSYNMLVSGTRIQSGTGKLSKMWLLS